jgi:glycoprotein 6-alpha-L-fucosyltransferase
MYETADIVEIPLIDNIHPKKDFMPMSIPEDISKRLTRLHGNPFVWFTGQLIRYFLRPQEWLIDFMEKKYQEIKFETPIVG